MSSETEGKHLEEEAWLRFHETGALPSPEELPAPERGRGVPENPHDNLLRLLALESSAARGPLTAEQERQQIEAARWCRFKLSPAKCPYGNREAMLGALEDFLRTSRNPALATLAKIRAHTRLLEELPDGPRKVKEALNGLRSLRKRKEDDPAFLAHEEVCWELVAIGWSLLKDPGPPRGRELQSVLELLDARPANPWQEKSIGKLRSRIVSMPAHALIDWSREAWGLLKDGKANHGECLRLAEELPPLVTPGSWQVFLEVTDDSQLGFFLFAAGRLFGALVKNGRDLDTRDPAALIEALLEIGNRLPSAAWTRPRKEGPPGQGNPCWPATVERFSMLAYTIVKRETGRNDLFKRDTVKPLIPRVIDFLKEVNEKLPDEWGDFRIGKLYLWADKREEACRLLGPVMRRKQDEFWTWDLLSELKPAHERACLAKALLCGADEKYLARIIRRAGEIGLDRGDRDALEAEAREAVDLLFKDLPREKAVVASLFDSKDGRQMARLVIDSGGHGEGIVRARLLPAPAYAGLCVHVRLDENGEIVRVEKREGEDWDFLPRLPATYAGHFRDRNGKPVHVLLVDGLEVCCFARDFPEMEEGATCQAVFKDQDAPRRLSELAAALFPGRDPAPGDFPARPAPFPARASSPPPQGRPLPPRDRPSPPGGKPPECVAALPAGEGTPSWLHAKRARGFSCGHNKKRDSIRVISPRQDFSVPVGLYGFPGRDACGVCLELCYSVRQTDKGVRANVWRCDECEDRGNLLSAGSGTARAKGRRPPFARGAGDTDPGHDLREDPFAFVRLNGEGREAYLSRELMGKLDAPLREGDPVRVGYVTSPRGLTAVSIVRETAPADVDGGKAPEGPPSG